MSRTYCSDQTKHDYVEHVMKRLSVYLMLLTTDEKKLILVCSGSHWIATYSNARKIRFVEGLKLGKLEIE